MIAEKDRIVLTGINAHVRKKSTIIDFDIRRT